jgi:hypothetical protein
MFVAGELNRIKGLLAMFLRGNRQKLYEIPAHNNFYRRACFQRGC